MADEEKEETTEEEAEEEPEEEKKKPSEELKIVIIVNPGKIMLGVQTPDCDPVYETLEGTLPTALKRVPKLVAEAKVKWDANPRNPKADLPEPEPAPKAARTVPAPAKKETKQPSFF